MCVDRIQVEGSVPLYGEVTVQGSKNAALPFMAAAVLHEGWTVLHNCPMIRDVEDMAALLKGLGCSVTWEGKSLLICAKEIKTRSVEETYATRLRASILLMGGLLGREREVTLPFPGGCTIGKRPIGLHLEAMEKLGAVVNEEEGRLHLTAARLKGCPLTLAFPSVGATENAILAAVFAEGITVIDGCAMEPEVAELCCFLKEKGAQIEGIGSRCVKIRGVAHLRDSEYTLMPDRIVAGSYLCAAAATGGCATLLGAKEEHLKAVTDALRRSGANIRSDRERIRINGKHAVKQVKEIITAPYPGFPTDLQSQWMAMAGTLRGTGKITENMFESRFLTVRELNKMGADIRVEHKTATVRGVRQLCGAEVTAYDLRGGAALVIAGLTAKGTTVIGNCHFIERGYEDICRDFEMLGARIRNIKTEEV